MAATVKGGLFAQYSGTLSTIETMSAPRKRIYQLFRDKSMAAARATLRALNGVVAGGAVLVTNGRIQAAEDLSGKRTIESETLINRVSAAADVTDLNADLLPVSSKSYTASPPANLDGNPLGTR